MEDKRVAIFAATVELIAEKGFHGTPMSAIARKARVSVGIIYHYFESKEELINELYKSLKLEFSKAILVEDSESMSPKKRFYKMFSKMVHFLALYPKGTTFVEQYENSPYYNHRIHEETHKNFELEIKNIEAGIKVGALKNLPLETIMAIVFKMAYLLAKQHNDGIVKLNDEIINSIAKASWDAIARHE